MRICFFKSNSLLVGGGAENLLIEVGTQLAKNHEVMIVTLDYLPDMRRAPKEIKSVLKGIEYSELASFKFPRGSALPTLFSLRSLVEIIRSCDLTYFVLPASPVELLFGFLGMITKRPVIAGIHGFLRKDVLLQQIYMPFFKKALRQFRAYHVTNRETSMWLKQEGLSNVYFIPNGVSSERFRFAETSRRSAPFNVLFTGRLSEDKGADSLVDIIHYVNSITDKLEFVFTIAGSGALASKVIEIEEIYDNVRYLGFVDPEELPAVYESAHLYLIPSKIEGMPLRLLEAQSCGLPSLGSKIFGISDFIAEGETGRLIDPSNIKGFADAIIEYYKLWRNSPDDYVRLSRHIRESVVRKYNWKETANAIERMIRAEI